MAIAAVFSADDFAIEGPMSSFRSASTLPKKLPPKAGHRQRRIVAPLIKPEPVDGDPAQLLNFVIT
jgi:hypothetical protein